MLPTPAQLWEKGEFVTKVKAELAETQAFEDGFTSLLHHYSSVLRNGLN